MILILAPLVSLGALAWLGIYAVTGWAVLPLLGVGLIGVVAFWRWIVTERYSPRALP